MMLPLKGPVVERDSALLGLPNEQSIPIGANHRDIVRFTSFDSHKFEPVLYAFKELVEGVPRNLREEQSDVYTLRLRLNVADYDAQLESIQSRDPDTCEWIAVHPSFVTWFESKNSDLIWLRGYSGVGKTTLTKYLVQSLLPCTYIISRTKATLIDNNVNNQTHFLGYFFCSKRDRGLQLEENILKSILHQLILADLNIVRKLQQFRRTGSYSFTYDTAALWAALKVALMSATWEVTYLIFDALDEMEPKELRNFAEGLRDLVDDVKHRIEPRSIKVLVTSRPIVEVDQSLGSASVAVSSERDIRHYIETRIERLRRVVPMSQVLAGEIISTICDKAGTMFLWARLAWEQLCQDVTTEEQLRRNLQISHLPSSLELLFEDILTRLENRDMMICRHLFELLVGSLRPLTTKEMRFAIALKGGAGTFSQVLSSMIAEDKLCTLCSNLIVVNESGHVQFVHISVKDFFLRPETDPRFRIDMKACHASLTVLCLQSLYLPGFDANGLMVRLCSRLVTGKEDMHDFSAEHSFLLYATQYWPSHAQSAEEDANVLRAFRTFHEVYDSLKIWFMLFLYDGTWLFQRSWHMYRKGSSLEWLSSSVPLPPPLHIAVYLKNTPLVKQLLTSGFNINVASMAPDENVPNIPRIPRQANVLHIKDIDIDTVRLLLSRGADVNALDSKHRTCITKAILDGDEQKATLFLDHCCQLSQTTRRVEYASTLLYTAANAQMSSIVQLIINDPYFDLDSETLLREDTSTTGTFITSPLEHLCLFGMESMARLMLEHPRIIEAQRKKDASFAAANPLPLAFLTTLQGWEDLTMIALQSYEIDIASSRDKDRRTILHHAVIEHWHEVLEICIGKVSPAKLNTMDKNGMTALHYAASVRNWYAARGLFEAGAQAHTEENQGRTPAHVAAEYGVDRVLRLMLDAGSVLPDHRDQKLRTVLHYVATWNLYTIAERLLEDGRTDPLAKDCDGRTAAHMAAIFGSTAVLSLMLGTGLLNVNAADSYGNTLLHCAVEGKAVSCIEELLGRDEIEVNLLNNLGKSPLDITMSYKEATHAAEAVSLLEGSGCHRGLWRPRRAWIQSTQSRVAPDDLRYQPPERWALVTLEYVGKLADGEDDLRYHHRDESSRPPQALQPNDGLLPNHAPAKENPENEDKKQAHRKIRRRRKG